MHPRGRSSRHLEAIFHWRSCTINQEAQLGNLEQNYDLQKGQLSGYHFGGIDMGVNRIL